MTAVERVGVVVVHGVGQTREGWIDEYLVPDLQRWSAYRSVGRDPEKNADPSLILVLPTSDFKQIAIALDTDAHTKAFWQLVQRDDLAERAEFKSAAARRTNRDALIDVTMDIVSRAPLETWLEALVKADIPAARAFDPTSSVHRVRDPDSNDPTRTWMAFQRNWPLPGRDVRFSELYWADLSNAGQNIGARLMATFELLSEAPFYLGRAMLRDSRGDIHTIIRRLIIAANWLIRWPVAGLNAAIFLTAFFAIFFLSSGPRLPMFVAGTLAAIGVFGVIICRNILHKRPGLADIALSTGTYAFLLLGLLVYFAGTTESLPLTPAPYLVVSILVLLAAWTIWTIPVVLAILLLGLVGLKRLLVRRRVTSPPIARPTAALGLNIVLAMLLKFIYAAFGLLVITTLVGAVRTPRGCPAGSRSSTQLMAMSDQLITASVDCQLVVLKRLLLDVSAFNSIAMALLVATALLLSWWRSLRKSISRQAAQDGKLSLPRLIAHPLILFMLCAGALLNAALVYWPGLADMRWSSAFLGVLRESGLEHLGAGALIVLVAALAVIVERSDAFIHIGRDLVDHQYDRNPKSAAMMVSQGSRRKDLSKPRKRYPRRLRIQRRLEALIEDVIAHQGCDRLIFLAHSQGTVIVRDYLLDQDRLMLDRRSQTDSMANMACIDVLSLGSPLSHIYRHYFADDVSSMHNDDRGTRAIEKVRSWTNLWRIDDPIAHAVDLSPILNVENRGIPPGGHTEYWREPPVCETLFALIERKP